MLVLRCPFCKREIAHQDRKGGLGFILRNRYVRVVPETRQIMVACPGCSQEILPGQLVDDTDRGKPLSTK